MKVRKGSVSYLGTLPCWTAIYNVVMFGFFGGAAAECYRESILLQENHPWSVASLDMVQLFYLFLPDSARNTSRQQVTIQ
jgi:hypothetical protein